jgi:hypothetical protein
MIIRNDLRTSSTIIPQEINATILRVGGTNIFNEPMYRLVLAEDRIQRAAGAWTIWKPGTSLDERSGLGIRDIQKMLLQYREVMEAAQAACSKFEVDRLQKQLGGQLDEFINGRLQAGKPLSVERGMKDIPVYNFTGFILEKWKPADTFGTPMEWTRFRFEGQAALGPYPTYGAYELISGPTPYMPTSEQVETAIRREARELNERSVSPQERVLKMMQEIEAIEEAEARETHRNIDAAYKETSVLMNRISLGAGKVRQELANKAGLDGHYGN